MNEDDVQIALATGRAIADHATVLYSETTGLGNFIAGLTIAELQATCLVMSLRLGLITEALNA